MRFVVFDIETYSPSNVRGRVDFSVQELTVVGVYNSETGAYTSYTKEELPQLWPILERTELLIGFNSDYFDIPILNRYYPGDLTKIRSLDLLTVVYNTLGRRLRLDSLAKATLGRGKSGHGTDAMDWWVKGEVEKIKKYCLDDVKLTKELYEYMRDKKSVKYKDFKDIRELKIDTGSWDTSAEAASLTHALLL